MTKCCKNGSVIAKMDKRIDILQVSTTRDSGGTRDQTWSVIATKWAKMTPKKTNPFLGVQDKQNQINYEIMVRFDPTLVLTAKQRIRFGSRFMFIRNFFNKDEDNIFTILEANENVRAAVTVV